MKMPPELRQARQDETLRMLREARECIDRVVAAPALQLSELTRHAAREVARLAQAEADRIESLPLHAAETWVAAAALTQAVERVEAVSNSPEAWAGMPTLFEAHYLLGAAESKRGDARRLADQRSKGGRATVPDSQAERIRAEVARRPAASSGQIANWVGVDARHVRRTKKRATRR